jgi:nucleotide-binding universal stress UspA family protein
MLGRPGREALTARKDRSRGAGTLGRMYRHILIPTDGSRVSESAAEAGVALARKLGARLTALHVVATVTDPRLEAWVHGDREFGDKVERAFERRGAVYLEAIREIARRAGIGCECAIARGPSPAGQIVREARERHCDLIVMASHGRRGPGGLAGSETLKVVAMGGVPVLAHHPSTSEGTNP